MDQQSINSIRNQAMGTQSVGYAQPVVHQDPMTAYISSLLGGVTHGAQQMSQQLPQTINRFASPLQQIPQMANQMGTGIVQGTAPIGNAVNQFVHNLRI